MVIVNNKMGYELIFVTGVGVSIRRYFRGGEPGAVAKGRSLLIPVRLMIFSAFSP